MMPEAAKTRAGARNSGPPRTPHPAGVAGPKPDRGGDAAKVFGRFVGALGRLEGARRDGGPRGGERGR